MPVRPCPRTGGAVPVLLCWDNFSHLMGDGRAGWRDSARGDLSLVKQPGATMALVVAAVSSRRLPKPEARRRWFRHAVLAINVVSAGALCLTTEFYLRWRGLRPYARTYPGSDRAEPNVHAGWAEPDPDLGWTVARTVPGVNRDGFRTPRDLTEPRGGPREPRVMVLGDSFAFGA